MVQAGSRRLPVQRPGHDTGPTRVGFKVEAWQRDRIYSEYFGSSPIEMIPAMLFPRMSFNSCAFH